MRGRSNKGESVRSILISGASQGLGAALASAFARRGDRVFSGVAMPREGMPGDVELNVRSPESVSKAVDQIARAAGGVDIVINSAAMHLHGPLATLEQDAFKETLDVNLLGAWRLSKAALPHLRPGDTIAMISSLSALVGLPDEGAYAASKFALEGMSQSLAAEVASLGLRVLVFAPGRVDREFPGASGGEAPETVAEEIAALIDRRDTPFRNPIGLMAREIIGALGVDDGTRAAMVAQGVARRGTVGHQA
ncbi:MAG: SDR family NAD(P)-dependent oxidoreductase [Pseudomonadota bacterium]